jgi:hypothetical protein
MLTHMFSFMLRKFAACTDPIPVTLNAAAKRVVSLVISI